MGAWVTYGLGSESQDLPGFVVLQSGPRGPRGGAVNWGSGFLPTTYQGVPLRGNGEPILNLTTPDGISADAAAAAPSTPSATSTSQRARRDRRPGNQHAHRRLRDGVSHADQRAGADRSLGRKRRPRSTSTACEKDKPSFARNCLLARRLVERGVRFVQLYHTNWDSHGGPGENLAERFRESLPRRRSRPGRARARPESQRGLLDDTLVIWGGEFGRTPMGENRDTTGRNHHIDAFTMWFAGGGVKPGIIIGETDELGFNAVEDRVPRPRPPRHDPPPARPRPRAAHLPLPRPRLPAHRCPGRADQEAAGLRPETSISREALSECGASPHRFGPTSPSGQSPAMRSGTLVQSGAKTMRASPPRVLLVKPVPCVSSFLSWP